MALTQEYFSLSEKYQKEYGKQTILLMQVGSFMEMYGPGTEINEVARICGLNVTQRSGDSKTLMAGFKENFIDKYVIKIQEAGYTAVIYTQHPDNPSLRSLHSIASPGTFFYTEKQVDHITNNIMCIWINVLYSRINKRTICYVGVAIVDVYTGNTNVSQYEIEYVEGSPTVFDQLERMVSTYQPLETIIISNLTEAVVNTIIQFSGINSKKIHIVDETNKSAENCSLQVYQKEVYTKFYGEMRTETMLPETYDNNMASQTLCYLLNFIYQHNPSLLNKIKSPVFDNNHSNRLVLANHSLKQLNIIDDGTYKGKYSSLLRLLNTCSTPMGKRAFEHQLLHPITSVVELQKQYDLIDHVFSRYGPEQLFTICEHMDKVCDVTMCIRQLHMFKISPKQLYGLYNSILEINNTFELIKDDPFLLEFSFSQNEVPFQVSVDTLRINMEQYLNMELCKDITETKEFDVNFFSSGIFPQLDQLISVRDQCREKMESLQDFFNCKLDELENKKKAGKTTKKKILSNNSAPEYVKIDYSDKSPPTFTCTQRRFELLRGDFPAKKGEHYPIGLNYSVDFTRENFTSTKLKSSGCVIHHNELTTLCDEYFETNIAINALVCSLYVDYVKRLEALCPELEHLEDFITQIDLVCCKALMAQKYGYCKPELCNETGEKSFVKAVGLRHPIIELLQEDEEYVDNDIALGVDNQDGVLLYGVNMAGKTSFIRSIGMSIIMAQAGLYVPATEFQYKPYNHIFTRIIGNDNLFKGLSTFAVEMIELNTILRMSTPNSMILGDEVCAGTETISACSIFVSAIQQLTHKESSYIFATHLHEIVDFEEIIQLETVALKHMDVRYDMEKGRLVYNRKLMDGSGSKMYGLEVCKSLHMPTAFLEGANDIRLKYFSKIENENLLEQKVSSYNSNKLVGLCEKCRVKQGTETHHIVQQKEADMFGFVMIDGKRVHKNKLRNLMAVCEKCHRGFHGASGGGGGSSEKA